MPASIAISSPQNQPALPVGLTTMFTITASSTTSSQREISRMRRMRACAAGDAGPSRSIVSAMRPPSGPRKPAPTTNDSANEISPKTIQFCPQDQSKLIIIAIPASSRIQVVGMKSRMPTISVSFAKSA